VVVAGVFGVAVLLLDGGDLRTALSRLRAPAPEADPGDVTG
jgi:hypothetical protein